MNRCLICFNRINDGIIKIKVCKNCLKKFRFIDKKFYLGEVEVRILYEYNDFFKEVLYRYKGCYDLLLKESFFNNKLTKLRKYYKGYTIVCAPSSDKANLERGFNHVNEIAKVLGLEIVDCLKKVKDYKQSDTKYNERDKIKDLISIDIFKLVGVKKILILDDVTTSLSTIKSIISLLGDSFEIRVLVLASNCRFLDANFI